MTYTLKNVSSANYVYHTHISSQLGYTIANESNAVKRNLSFNRNNGEKWIYVNYPETFHDGLNCFANSNRGGRYLFQEVLNANQEVQLFFSHINHTSGNVNYCVQFFNPNGTTASITISNKGCKTGWDDAAMSAWNEFFDSTPETLQIAPYGSVFPINMTNIENNKNLLSGNMRFTVHSRVIVTVYAWLGNDITVITGNETQYPYNINESGIPVIDSDPAKKYTGVGDGYFITTSTSITNTNLAGNSIYFELANVGSGNTNEIIPIVLSGANYTASESASHANLKNLGNWCAQYLFNITFQNTSTTSKTFRGYLGRNGTLGRFLINCSNTIISANMSITESNDESTPAYDPYKWNWVDVTLAANETSTFSFQFIHATCGSSPIYMQWELV